MTWYRVKYETNKQVHQYLLNHELGVDELLLLLQTSKFVAFSDAMYWSQKSNEFLFYNKWDSACTNTKILNVTYIYEIVPLECPPSTSSVRGGELYQKDMFELFISTSMVQEIDEKLLRKLKLLRTKISEKFGVIVPAVRIRDKSNMEDDCAMFFVFGVEKEVLKINSSQNPQDRLLQFLENNLVRYCTEMREGH